MTVREALRHSFSVIARIHRQGGSARIALPDLATGKLLICNIDQRVAEEIVAWAADIFIAALQRQKDRGEPLSATEETALRLWREKVPHAYNWGAVPGGPSFLLPLNLYGEPIGPLHEAEVILAAHPSEYDIGWIVPRTRQAPGLRGSIRLDGSHRWGRRDLIGHLRFPPGIGLLTAWTRFDHVNQARAMQRLSPEDQRRYLFPYGAVALPNGRQLSFNRDYQPLHARSGTAGDPAESWFYFDRHSEHEKRQRAEEAHGHFRAGEPLPPDRPSHTSPLSPPAASAHAPQPSPE